MNKLKFRTKDSVEETEKENTTELDKLISKVDRRRQIQSQLMVKAKSQSELKQAELKRRAESFKASVETKINTEQEESLKESENKITSYENELDILRKKCVSLELENDHLLERIEELELKLAFKKFKKR